MFIEHAWSPSIVHAGTDASCAGSTERRARLRLRVRRSTNSHASCAPTQHRARSRSRRAGSAAEPGSRSARSRPPPTATTARTAVPRVSEQQRQQEPERHEHRDVRRRTRSTPTRRSPARGPCAAQLAMPCTMPGVRHRASARRPRRAPRTPRGTRRPTCGARAFRSMSPLSHSAAASPSGSKEQHDRTPCRDLRRHLTTAPTSSPTSSHRSPPEPRAPNGLSSSPTTTRATARVDAVRACRTGRDRRRERSESWVRGRGERRGQRGGRARRVPDPQRRRAAPRRLRRDALRLARHPRSASWCPGSWMRTASTSGRCAAHPSVLRAWADALIGAERARAVSGAGRDRDRLRVSTTTPRPTDWAEGSTQLISAACWQACGPWDDSYFLYSEETEYDLRARDQGFTTLYQPAAVAQHLEGGSAGTFASGRCWSPIGYSCSAGVTVASLQRCSGARPPSARRVAPLLGKKTSRAATP